MRVGVWDEDYADVGPALVDVEAGEHGSYHAVELAKAIREAGRIAWYANREVQPHDVR